MRDLFELNINRALNYCQPIGMHTFFSRERKVIPDRFKDKVAIVTGGTSGIGFSILTELLKEGCSVAFTGRNANTDWKTLINYQFGINVDGEREALEVIESKFLNILNTNSTYEQLIDALDNKFDGRQEWTSNYIGNVTGSSSEDSVAVNTLFAGQLQITVGDTAVYFISDGFSHISRAINDFINFCFFSISESSTSLPGRSDTM